MRREERLLEVDLPLDVFFRICRLLEPDALMRLPLLLRDDFADCRDPRLLRRAEDDREDERRKMRARLEVDIFCVMPRLASCLFTGGAGCA